MKGMLMYEVIDYYNKDGDQVIAIEITSGKYINTVFSFGEVEFPDENEPMLSFNYDLHEGTIDDELQIVMGDILVELIEKSIEDRDTIFHGGI